MKKIVFAFLLAVSLLAVGCDGIPDSDKVQQDRQEQLTKQAGDQVGMPNIKNFRELKLMKDLYELRDQDGLVTFTYVENLSPQPIKGVTALGGKFTFIGESIGYGIPYATQFSNPEKATWGQSHGWLVLPQSEPNALFMPTSAEGTWVMLKDPGGKDVKPVYLEPRIMVSPFKFPSD